MDLEKRKAILNAEIQLGIQKTKLQELELKRLKSQEDEGVIKVEILKYESEISELKKT